MSRAAAPERAGQSSAPGRADYRVSWQRSGVLPIFAGASCFLAMIQVAVIGLGIAEVRLSQPLALLILLVAAATAWAFAARFRPSDRLSTEHQSAANPDSAADRVLRLAGVALLAWAGWVWVRLWALAASRPPYDWDGLTYHVPAINAWVRRGYVAFITEIPDVPVVNYPMGVELTSFFTHYLFQTSRLVDACNLWYWPLGIAALAVTAALLGARGIYRWLAGGLLVGASVYVSQSVTAYIDPGFASTTMAAVAAACVYVFDGRSRLIWRGALLGMTAGLMLGSKGFGLPFAAIVLAVTALGTLAVRGADGWRRELLALGAAALVILAVGGYWYVRNAAVTGNPIYPIQLAIGDKTIIPGWDHSYFAAIDLPAWLSRYPGWARPFVAWLQLDGPVHGYGWTAGGLGYIWLLAAVPAICVLWLAVLRRRSPAPAARLAFLTAISLLLFLVIDARWWARQTLWLHVLGLPCVAVVVCDAASRWRSAIGQRLTIALALTLMGLVVWESGRTLGIEQRTGRDATSATSTAFAPTLDRHFSELRHAPGFRELLDARIIGRGRWSTGYGQLLGGVLALPLGQREIVVLPPETDAFRDPYRSLSVRDEPQPEEIAALVASGVEWFLWDEAAAGQLPESLARYAAEHYAYRVGDIITLHTLRLKRGPQLLEYITTNVKSRERLHVKGAVR